MKNQESDTKKRILVAAEAEFLVGGYDGSRMQAIADRAQINKAMLHYHFRSKNELFAAIFKAKALELFPKVQANLHTNKSFISFTCGFVDAYYELLIENPYLPGFLMHVAASHLELLEKVPIHFPKLFVAAFKTEVSKGTIRPHDAEQFLISLIGMCVIPFVGRNLFKSSLKLDEPSFDSLLLKRAAEIKEYVILILTPEPNEKEEGPDA